MSARLLPRLVIPLALCAPACDDVGGGGSGDVNQMPGSTPSRTVKNPPRKAVTREQAEKAVEFVKALDPASNEVVSAYAAYVRAVVPAAQGKSFDPKAVDQAYATALGRIEKIVKDVEAVPDHPDKLGADYKTAVLAYVNWWLLQFKTTYAEEQRFLKDPSLRRDEKKQASLQGSAKAQEAEDKKLMEAVTIARNAFVAKYRYVQR